LTSGFTFSQEESETKINYMFFNAILLINACVVGIGALVRYWWSEDLFAVIDLGFCFLSLTFVVLARLDRRYYTPLTFLLLLTAFGLTTAVYILRPYSIIGTSWYLVIMMLSYYFTQKWVHKLTFVASIISIYLISLHRGEDHKDIILGLLPLASAYAFLWFADNRHNLLRSAIEEEKEHFAHHAIHDYLTGTYNRYYFFKTAEKLIESSRKNGSVFSLIFIDIDEFKQINDLYGHLAGDSILKQTAERINQELPSNSFFARLGGDEFVILLEDRIRADATDDVLKKLHKAINKPCVYEGISIPIRISIGVAHFPENGSTVSELLEHADQTMYRTKNANKQAKIL